MGGVFKAAGGALGGLFGKGGGSQRGQADQLQAEGFQAIKDLKIPELASLQINPNEITYFQQTGKLTPKLEQAFQVDPTLFDKIQRDPNLVKIQLETLNKLQEVAGGGGFDPTSRAKLYAAAREAERPMQQQREATKQAFRERGIGGSNAELMAQLSGQQGASEVAAQQGFNVASEAAKNALAAATQRGDLAGQMASEKEKMEMMKQQARAGLEQFNVQNKQGVAQRFIDRDLMTQAQNLAEQQRIADANVGTKNQLMQYGKNLIRENYGRQADKANMLAGAAGKYSAYLTGRAAQEDAAAVNKGAAIGGLIDTAGEMGSKIMGSMGSMGGGGMSSFSSDKEAKTNIKSDDSAFDRLLDHIKGHKFEYKDEADGEGQRVGVMAQDLEKSELGKTIVKEGEDGKEIDVANAVGASMGALARLNERIKKLEDKDEG